MSNPSIRYVIVALAIFIALVGAPLAIFLAFIIFLNAMSIQIGPREIEIPPARFTHIHPRPQWSYNRQSIVIDFREEILGVSNDGERIWTVPHPESTRDYSSQRMSSVRPDGRVAYIESYYCSGFFSFCGRFPHKFDVRTANIDGNDIRSLRAPGRRKEYPTWSPKGSHLALISSLDSDQYVAQRTLVVMNTEDLSVAQFPPVPENRLYQPVVWSDNGEKIAYVTYEEQLEYNVARPHMHQLSTANRDGSDIKVVAEVHVLGASISQPAWSISDDRIYFAKTDGKVDSFQTALYSIRPDGSDQRLIVRLDEVFRVHNIEISPDGKELLLTSSSSKHDQIHLINTDGTNLRRLADGYDFTNDSVGASHISRSASWSSDGSRIAVLNHGAIPIIDGRRIVFFTMARDGSDIRALIVREDGIMRPGHGELLQPAEDPAVAE